MPMLMCGGQPMASSYAIASSLTMARRRRTSASASSRRRSSPWQLVQSPLATPVLPEAGDHHGHQGEQVDGLGQVAHLDGGARHRCRSEPFDGAVVEVSHGPSIPTAAPWRRRCPAAAPRRRPRRRTAPGRSSVDLPLLPALAAGIPATR